MTAAAPHTKRAAMRLFLYKGTTYSSGVKRTGTSVSSVSMRRQVTFAEASIRFDAFVLSAAAYLSER